MPSKKFVRVETVDSRTKVEDAFEPRIANKCKLVGIRELGDFENNTINILFETSMTGWQTIRTVENTLREAHIMWIEEKVRLLQEQASMIVKWQRCKNTDFGSMLKQKMLAIINQID